MQLYIIIIQNIIKQPTIITTARYITKSKRAIDSM